jgi:hypothetical protein
MGNFPGAQRACNVRKLHNVISVADSVAQQPNPRGLLTCRDAGSLKIKGMKKLVIIEVR